MDAAELCAACLQERYSFAWTGDLAIDAVRLDYDPSDVLRLSDEQQGSIDRNWDSLKERGFNLHDSPLYRLRSIADEGDSIRLELGRTSYREYQGTNIARPDCLPDSASSFANPLALALVAVTSDGFVVVHRRSEHTAEYQGRWHVTPAGYVDPPEGLSDAVVRELEEELGVRAEELVSEPRVCAIVMNADYHKHDVLFYGSVDVTFEDVLKRRRQDAWEYERLEPVRWDPEAIKDWLGEHVEDVVPQGHAALLAAGASAFDDPWFRGLADALRSLRPVA